MPFPPSQLTQADFDLLSVSNGGWNRLVTDPPIGFNNSGNDDLEYTNLVSAALANGGAGNDRIHITGALTLASIVNGGDGDDYIHGGAGADTLSGGAGDLGGTDTLSYEFSNLGVNVNMAQLNALGNITVSGGHANGDLVSNDFENVVGSALNDTITGNASNNTLIGLGGDDTLNGGGGTDRLDGGAGNDQIYGGDGKDFVYGDASDSLYGGAGNDVMFGSGRAVVRGEDGNDELHRDGGGTLLDIVQLHGGAGDDYIQAMGAGTAVNGGPGRDTIRTRDFGMDRFGYSDISDSPFASPDIVEFDPKDTFDRPLAPGRQHHGRRTSALQFYWRQR